MFKNHIMMGLRSLLRFRWYSTLNILGLAVGMSCSLVITMWVVDELSYDRYHVQAENIYRLCVDADFGTPFQMPIFSAPAAAALVEDFPEVQAACRFNRPGTAIVEVNNNLFKESDVAYADASVFQIFSYDFISGDPATALQDPYTVVLTESIARKYFGESEAMGESLKFGGRSDYRITGVVEDVPKNSHFAFNMLCSMSTMELRDPDAMSMWFNIQYYTYLLLADGTDPVDFETKLPGFIQAHMGDQLKAASGTLEGFLQPLTSIHLRSRLENDIGINGDITYIYLFFGIALLTLIMACVNYINLSTARSVTRSKEVAVRKTLGADRRILILQFLGESVLCAITAGVLALFFTELVLPFYNNLTGKELNLITFFNPQYIIGFVVIIFMVGIAAGLYPAMLLSSFPPLQIFQSLFYGRRKKSAKNFRKSLVILQFTNSLVLIICTLIIYNQLQFIQTKKLGYNADNLIVIPYLDESILNKLDTVKNELLSVNGVESVAAATFLPGHGFQLAITHPQGFTDDQPQTMLTVDIDSEFISNLGIELIKGRNFSKDILTDQTDTILINETAVRKYGWKEPLGMTIRNGVRTDTGFVELERTVIGVVRDFHQQSLHNRIEPLIIGNRTDNLEKLAIRLKDENIQQTLSLLKERWELIDPARPFDFYFIDETLRSTYASEIRLGTFAFNFSLLAVFIGCLGLFGLSSFTAERRTKEIGIRKVLGATSATIFQFLTREYIILAIASNLVAWPIAWLASRTWLSHFAYRAELSYSSFFLAAVISLVIVIATVSFHSIKAAVTNPVNSLKYE